MIARKILPAPRFCVWCSAPLARGELAYMDQGRVYCTIAHALEERHEQRHLHPHPLPFNWEEETSLTDDILTLTASGQYGVREAIATVL